MRSKHRVKTNRAQVAMATYQSAHLHLEVEVGQNKAAAMTQCAACKAPIVKRFGHNLCVKCAAWAHAGIRIVEHRRVQL